MEQLLKMIMNNFQDIWRIIIQLTIDLGNQKFKTRELKMNVIKETQMTKLIVNHLKELMSNNKIYRKEEKQEEEVLIIKLQKRNKKLICFPSLINK